MQMICHLLQAKDKVLLRNKAQKSLDEMGQWSEGNGLVLNKNKTTALNFYNRWAPDSSPLIWLGGTSIHVSVE